MMVKKLNKAMMAASAVAVLGLASQSAFAAGTNATDGQATFMTTIGATKDIAAGLVAKKSTTLGTAVDYDLFTGNDLSVDDKIRIDLSNGATFAATPTLTLAGGGVVAVVNGGAGHSFTEWRVTTALTATAAGTADITVPAAATVDLSDVPADSSVTAKLTLNGLVGGSPTTLYNSGSAKTTSDPVLKVVPTAAVTTVTGTDLIRVSSGFKKLGTTSTGPESLTSGGTYTVTITPDASAYTPTSVDGTLPASGNELGTAAVANKVMVTLTGDMTGITKIEDTTVGDITSADSAGAAPTGGTVADEFFIDGNKAYAIVSAGFTGVKTLNLLFTVDGTTVLNNRDFQVAVKFLGNATATDGLNAETYQADTAIGAWTRDGSSFASNSVGNLNTIRVTDRSGALGGASGADGSVVITAYTADGTSCSAVPATTVPNNGSVNILGSDIQTACPDTVRVEGTVNSTNIVVSNIKNSPTSGISITPAVVTSGGTGGI